MESIMMRTMVDRKTFALGGAAILCFAVLLIIMIITPRIAQSQSYHHFADHRNLFFGIPNTLNVVSNFPFLVIGLVGLVICHHRNHSRLILSLQWELSGWTCFYIGVVAVAFGSSYYHLNPNDTRLVCDRLPMSVAFTSIMATFIVERVDERKGAMSFITLLAAGPVSILYWRLFNDLRPYYLVQLVPCIAIPAMAITLPPLYTHSTYWLWAAGFYSLAKLEQSADKLIYDWTHNIVSGYTLKHLCAAMVPVFLTLMLAKRTIETNRQSILEKWRISWAEVKAEGYKEEISYTTVSTVEPQT